MMLVPSYIYCIASYGCAKSIEAESICVRWSRVFTSSQCGDGNSSSRWHPGGHSCPIGWWSGDCRLWNLLPEGMRVKMERNGWWRSWVMLMPLWRKCTMLTMLWWCTHDALLLKQSFKALETTSGHTSTSLSVKFWSLSLGQYAGLRI